MKCRMPPSCFDLPLHGCPLVAREILHDDDAAKAQLGYKDLRHLGFEPVALDRSVEHHRCDHVGHAHAGNLRASFAVTMRKAHVQPRASPAAVMAADLIWVAVRVRRLRLQLRFRR